MKMLVYGVRCFHTGARPVQDLVGHEQFTRGQCKRYSRPLKSRIYVRAYRCAVFRVSTLNAHGFDRGADGAHEC